VLIPEGELQHLWRILNCLEITAPIDGIPWRIGLWHINPRFRKRGLAVYNSYCYSSYHGSCDTIPVRTKSLSQVLHPTIPVASEKIGYAEEGKDGVSGM